MVPITLNFRIGEVGRFFNFIFIYIFLAPLSAKAESVALGIGCIEYRE